MRQARKYGYDAEGYEVSEFSVEFARTQDLKVFSTSSEIPSQQYDIVTCVEVLEHCFSPMQALQSIYRSLKPGGVFFYTTVNFDGYYEHWSRGKKDNKDGYINPEGHINFFTSAVMKAYFKKIGYAEVFSWEPSIFEKGTRVYKILRHLRLINQNADRPQTSFERVLYQGARKASVTLLRRRRRLPLAMK